MKLKLFIVLLIVLPFIFSATAQAKKKLIRPLNSNSTKSLFQPRLREDRQALLLIFGDLTEAEKISYELTYMSEAVGQGVTGIDEATSSANTQKELVFGTCSKAVCTYNKNITDMILQTRISLKSGKTQTQKYQIKP